MTSVLDYGYPYHGQTFLFANLAPFAEQMTAGAIRKFPGFSRMEFFRCREYRFRAQSVPCGSQARRFKLYDLHQMK